MSNNEFNLSSGQHWIWDGDVEEELWNGNMDLESQGIHIDKVFKDDDRDEKVTFTEPADGSYGSTQKTVELWKLLRDIKENYKLNNE